MWWVGFEAELVLLAVGVFGLAALMLQKLNRYFSPPGTGVLLTPAQTVWTGLAGSAAVFCASMYIHSFDGFPDRLPASGYGMRSRDAMWQWDCPYSLKLNDREFCGMGEPWQQSKRKVLLWGDSHAAHLAPIVDVVARQHDASVILENSCPAVLGGHVHRRWPEVQTYIKDCITARAAVLKTLAANPDIETVVLAAAWSSLAETAIFADDGRATADKLELISQAMAELANDLRSLKRKVVIVDNMTGPGTDLTGCVLALESRIFRRTACRPDDLNMDSYKKRYSFDPFAKALNKLAGPEVSIIHPIDGMCRGANCLAYVNGEFIWMDYSHIRRNLTDETNLELGRLLGLSRIFTAAKQ